MGAKNSKQISKKMAADIEQLRLQRDVSTADDNLIGKVDVLEPGSLGVFPEEIWEAILNHVQCSRDIQNVFLAFPVLGRIFHKKKGDWLFGLVLPHLITKHLTMKMLKDLGVEQKWTQSKELTNLRLVSKRWKNTVDSTLLQSVLPSANHTCQLDENHFNFLPRSDYHLGTTIFHSAEQVDKFMHDMANYQGNPFPGKSVWIRPVDAIGRNSENLTKKCVDLFKKFGMHVDVLDLGFYDREIRCHFKICSNILNCLFNLPNLRSLTFKGQFEGQRGDEDEDDFRTDWKTSKTFEKAGSQKLYPKLANLESFDWQVLVTNSSTVSAWAVGMIKAYGKGSKLRKLGIDEKLYWSLVKVSSLVNLTELNLFLNEEFGQSIGKLGKILRSLPGHGKELKKLGFRQLKPCKSEVKINLYELMGILGSFQIESLVLEDLHLEEKKHDFEGKICAAETITSLFIEDNLDLTFEFLGTLPNLRFLTVHENNEVRADACIEFEKNNVNVEESLATKLRKAIIKPSKPDLSGFWEKLPKLEMIRGTVHVYLPICGVPPGFNLDVQYVRECGHETFVGNMPEWDEMSELFHMAHEDDEDDDEDEEDDEDEDFWQ